MKTPDEIKKGMKACLELECSSCPFFFGKEHCTLEMARDALAYIEQLERSLAQAEQERDVLAAALEGIKFCGDCLYLYSKDQGM